MLLLKPDPEFLKAYGLNPEPDLKDFRSLDIAIALMWTWVQENLKPGETLLDLPCGNDAEQLPTGDRREYALGAPARRYEPWLSRAATWKGVHVTGIDLSPRAPAVLRGPNGGTWSYRAADLFKTFPIARDEKFNCVASNGWVHFLDIAEASPNLGDLCSQIAGPRREFAYMSYRTTFLKEAMARVKEGGRFAIQRYTFTLNSTRDPYKPTLVPCDSNTQFEFEHGIVPPTLLTWPYNVVDFEY